MLPILVLVGRPNVGKSTLFNRLTQSRAALVADFPGLTRDRHYGRGSAGGRRFIVVDTGGFEPVAKSGILHEMAKQTRAAIAEADAVVFLVDGREGLTEQDRTHRAAPAPLRAPGIRSPSTRPRACAPERVTAEFHELALGEPYPISAAHGENVDALTELALACGARRRRWTTRRRPPDAPIKVAIVGRPNVGKSTLVNTLLGEERVIAFDEPGTTRDALYLDFERAGRRYTLIDTAGVRRRGKVFESVEKFSVVKTLQAIEDANVVVLLLDADEGITEQDAHLAGYILEAGRALVVGINKWDRVPAGAPRRREARPRSQDGLSRVRAQHFISARDGHGHSGAAALGRRRVRRGHGEAADAQAHPGTRGGRASASEPPRAGSGRPKLRYAHQGGQNPPLIVIHGTALRHVPATYRRYLEHFFRRGVPTSRYAP